MIRPRGILEWAAISEIVASIAVVLSLVFVGLSINRQVDELQADNVNDLNDSVREIEIAMITNPDLADTVRLAQEGSYETLTALHVFRYDRYMMLNTDIWQQAFDRFQDGTLAASQFADWDRYNQFFVQEWLPKESWDRIRDVYSQPFREHVDAMYEMSK